jgi:hypothetical protein
VLGIIDIAVHVAAVACAKTLADFRSQTIAILRHIVDFRQQLVSVLQVEVTQLQANVQQPAATASFATAGRARPHGPDRANDDNF